MYKEDLNDAEFNGKDEHGEDRYPQNDKWFDAIKDQYFALVHKSDEKLETLAEQVSAKVGGGGSKPNLAMEKFKKPESRSCWRIRWRVKVKL